MSADAWDSLSWRAAFGLNYYVLQHRLKFQFMQREVFNTLGVSHLRTHETFLQAQLVF